LAEISGKIRIKFLEILELTTLYANMLPTSLLTSVVLSENPMIKTNTQLSTLEITNMTDTAPRKPFTPNSDGNGATIYLALGS